MTCFGRFFYSSTVVIRGHYAICVDILWTLEQKKGPALR